ncbi:mucoidy inhibitor MuiA family protein [Streptomyces sp. NPDC097619]|uniref:mucoidy inhibitor MuiA family protein n=1 Tax=Streptomyces sp. NPDC097619 TaxID=3157228 RepID=UPI00331C2347
MSSTPNPITPNPIAQTPIALPVTAVTCLEDRARIERSTVLDLVPGVQRLRLGPVSALAVDRTLHAELTGTHPATVLDLRIVRTWTPRGPVPSEDDPVLRQRAHTLQEERLDLGRRRDRLTTRLDLLDRLAADLLREIAEGAGHGETGTDRWAAELDRVDGERDAHAERLHTTDTRLTDLDAELAALQRALDATHEQPAELVGHIELTVDATAAGPAELRLRHMTPCALWRPAYRAVLDGNSLTLETDAMVWQRTGEDWSDVRLTLSTARSARAAEPPRLTEDRLTLTDRTAAERRTLDVELREEETTDLGPKPVVGLPGLDDGGEARELTAPAPVHVPGDGRAHRVPVSAFTTSAEAEHACAPELSPLVTQVVRFDNHAGHALLAGPVDLVRGSGFSGRGTLDFTAPGAPTELAFGSSDDWRVTRRTEESRDTTGLTQRTVITRTVRLHVSRFSAPAEQGGQGAGWNGGQGHGQAAGRTTAPPDVVLRERIPVAEVAAVDVRLLTGSCSPAPDAVDADGIVRWDLSVPPGGRRTVTLVYELSAKAKVAGL